LKRDQKGLMKLIPCITEESNMLEESNAFQLVLSPICINEKTQRLFVQVVVTLFTII
jgi:hypothetical protein